MFLIWMTLKKKLAT